MSAIPPIDDKKLYDLAKRIRPVNRFIPRPWGMEIAEKDQCKRMYIPRYYLKLKDGLDLRFESFMWEAVPGDEVRDLKEIERITTYHSFAAPEQFKPTIAEVLAAIPAERLDRVIAFEVLHDSTAPLKHFGKSLSEAESFHEAETILFEKA